jgi:hypothetical protein
MYGSDPLTGVSAHFLRYKTTKLRFRWVNLAAIECFPEKLFGRTDKPRIFSFGLFCFVNMSSTTLIL